MVLVLVSNKYTLQVSCIMPWKATETWWYHQMETFSALRSPVGSPHKGQWRGALICAWINSWANNRDIGDLRRLVDLYPWWRHQRETFSASLAICMGNSPVTDEFPTQSPVTRSFDVFFDLRPNKRLSKQSRGWWFGALSHPLWRHCNAMSIRGSLLSGLVQSYVWPLGDRHEILDVQFSS